jgi:hypothetical protein
MPRTRIGQSPDSCFALEALNHLRPREDSPLLFPNARGGHLDFRNFNRRHWKPVQRSVGIEPLRDLDHLRYTYATFALRAGVPVFALSRFMAPASRGSTFTTANLAVESYQHAVSLLDALALERAVDAGWTSARRPAKPHSDTVSRPHRRPCGAEIRSRCKSMTLRRRPNLCTPRVPHGLGA